MLLLYDQLLHGVLGDGLAFEVLPVQVGRLLRHALEHEDVLLRELHGVGQRLRRRCWRCAVLRRGAG